MKVHKLSQMEAYNSSFDFIYYFNKFNQITSRYKLFYLRKIPSSPKIYEIDGSYHSPNFSFFHLFFSRNAAPFQTRQKLVQLRGLVIPYCYTYSPLNCRVRRVSHFHARITKATERTSTVSPKFMAQWLETVDAYPVILVAREIDYAFTFDVAHAYLAFGLGFVGVQ